MLGEQETVELLYEMKSEVMSDEPKIEETAVENSLLTVEDPTGPNIASSSGSSLQPWERFLERRLQYSGHIADQSIPDYKPDDESDIEEGFKGYPDEAGLPRWAA